MGGYEGIERKIKEEIEKSEKSERRKSSRKENLIIKNLRYKLYKLCVLLYEIHKPGDRYAL